MKNTTSIILAKEFSLLKKGVKIKKQILNNYLFIWFKTDKIDIKISVDINASEEEILKKYYELEKRIICHQ